MGDRLLDALVQLDAMVGRMTSWELALLAAVSIAIVPPALVLIHELGHAIAVRLLGLPLESLVVGDSDDVIIRARGVILRFGRSLDQRAPGGFVTFDATRATARDIIVIALAGPMGNLVSVPVFVAAALFVGSGEAVTACLWLSAFSSVTIGVTSLIPAGRPGTGDLLTDGRIAQLAWAELRGQTIECPVPAAGPPSPIPEPQPASEQSYGMRWPFKVLLLLVAGLGIVGAGPVALVPLFVLFGSAWLTGAHRHKVG
jgi:hypothetical protein